MRYQAEPSEFVLDDFPCMVLVGVRRSGKSYLLYHRIQQLFRIYGHDIEHERVFFYGDKFEVDFYVPEDELAIQVCLSLNDEETRQREFGALQKLSKRLSCRRRLIITYDEERIVEDNAGKIEIIPCWKWLLKDD